MSIFKGIKHVASLQKSLNDCIACYNGTNEIEGLCKSCYECHVGSKSQWFKEEWSKFYKTELKE